MTLRRRLSVIVNKFLKRFGYSVVRATISDENSVRFNTHGSRKFAYEDIILFDLLSPWSNDAEFLALRELVKDHTLVDRYRCYELYQMVREVAALPGDILEVGVWRGGTGAVLAAAAKRWKPEARVFLCDTFTGVVKAGAQDAAYTGGEHADTSKDHVAALLARVGVDNTTLLQGIFPEDTGAAVTSAHIALCHVDVDVYQSAADIIAWVKPRMVAGACLVFDDYGYSSCTGITQIVDEMRETGEWIYFYNLNKHAILIKR